MEPGWLAALVLAGAPSDEPATDAARREAAVAEALGASPRDWPRPLLARTRPLVGAAYGHSPLGEGEGQDPDPLLRFDRFDCTTFVETALALTRSSDLEELTTHLSEIRYRGTPGFQNRRHLMTSQWIPDLIEGGWVEDVTRAVGGREARTVRLRLTPKRWRQRRIARKLKLPAEAVPSGVFILPVLPLDAFEDRLPRVPEGTILNLVRVNWRLSPDLVTHQGLLFRRRGRWMMRHASPVGRRVRDEPISKILERYRKPRKWPIAGVHLLRVLPPQPPG
ncbi:MAG: N-acetylmuramoyl-L-alanine amidase-like domain-containing protein [Myxococcota bacterium]